jgi:hypothetical protein
VPHHERLFSKRSYEEENSEAEKVRNLVAQHLAGLRIDQVYARANGAGDRLERFLVAHGIVGGKVLDKALHFEAGRRALIDKRRHSSLLERFAKGRFDLSQIHQKNVRRADGRRMTLARAKGAVERTAEVDGQIDSQIAAMA